jgi:hypothetical protein
LLYDELDLFLNFWSEELRESRRNLIREPELSQSSTTVTTDSSFRSSVTSPMTSSMSSSHTLVSAASPHGEPYRVKALSRLRHQPSAPGIQRPILNFTPRGKL